jgi:hypothetical protein
MGSDSKNERQNIHWSRLLAIVQHYWEDMFPDNNLYDNSIWSMWESRIRTGHEAEEKLITKIIKRMEVRLTPEQKESTPDDMFADDFWRTSHLTNNMYAALIVSLWSSMGAYLEDLIWICIREKNLKKKAPHEFGAIKDSFKEIGIDIENLPRYSTVNAIRILNNSFKHSEGYYLPKTGETHTQIASYLLTKWKCTIKRSANQREIDYTKLPIRELVVACAYFCQQLLMAIEKNLEGLGFGT